MELSPPTRRSLLAAAAVLSFLASAVLTSCGGSDTKKAASAATGFDSEYCVTARTWAVHELNGGSDGAYARGGPAALRKWWNDQLAFFKTSVQQAPPAIHDAEVINERATRTRMTPVLAKYGFDPKRIDTEGSASEKAALESTSAAAKAEAAIRTYQDGRCGYGGSPPPAKVTFKASSASKAYCAASASQGNGLGKVVSSGFDPAAFRTYVTSGRFLAALDAEDQTAPAEIAADVKLDNAWVRDRKLKVLRDFGYDLRRLLLEGSAHDLAVFTYWHPAIAEHDSRVEAYQQQICAG